MLGSSAVSRRPRPLRLEQLEERATPAALTPAQVRQAYGFNQVAAINSTTLNGAGQTIAIVDAYNDPYALSDLQKFDRQYGLPDPPSFKQVNQTGSTTNLPQADSGWAGEIALDVEWAHAIAPGANILLVEARSSSLTDLFQAVDYARNAPGVSVVSMSWDGSEFNGETSYNSHFATPAGHQGVSFIASSGDSGAGASFPAVSPNVLAVGGTRLTVSSSGAYVSETAWSDSGGGPSQLIGKPSYQTAYTGSTRGSPDVAYDADPNTGFSVYNSYAGGWEQVGGTSAGAPQWAALVAIADQGRALKGLGTLDGGSQLLPDIYAMPAGYFHDVTSGSNGYSAKSGYDLSTGRGSPIAQNVVAYLTGSPVTTTTGGTTGTTGTGGSTTGSTTGSSTGGTSTGGTTSGGGWTWGWGWSWGWGWGGWSWSWSWYSPWFRPTAVTSAPAQTTSAFTIDMPKAVLMAPTVTTAKAIVVDGVATSVVLQSPTSDPWAAQLGHLVQLTSPADYDWAPILV
jgi:subtilase family serine protease